MKDRVLSVLNQLHREPLKSYYLPLLCERLNKDQEWISSNAAKIKTMMLHDYSRISVQTIDRFFQGILRTFARESGLAPTFQLELDNQKVLADFARDVFKRVLTDPPLKEWLTDWITERMEEGEKWQKLEKEIINTGFELLKEEILTLVITDKSDALTEEKIRLVKNQARLIMRRYRETSDSIRQRTRELLVRTGCTPVDFQHGLSGPAGFLYKLEIDKDPTSRATNSLDDPSKWIAKNNPRKAELETNVYPELNRLMHEALDHFASNHVEYHSAKAVNRNLFALWFSSYLFRFLREDSKNRNQILLTLTQPMIQTIIRDNPSPFIFEKTGIYFKNYMIDEFQDTSDLQWKNFSPLIENSLAEGGLSMVVGDAKQSLYRWRNSNWKLIQHKAAEDMKRFGATVTPLIKNQRSRKSIIGFNNHLFSTQNSISGVYQDAEQEEGVKAELTGLVEMHLIHAKNEEKPWRDQMQERLPMIVEDLLQNKGYRQEDILFLVRMNRDADEISEILTKYRSANPGNGLQPWSFVSADVFRIDSSGVVQVILLIFRYISSRSGYYLDLLNWELQLRLHPGAIPPPDHDGIAKGELAGRLDTLADHDPLSILDQVVRFYQLDNDQDELQYLFQFRDQVKAFCAGSSGHVAGFLEWWEVSGSKKMLVTENQAAAMRIMTIHKAKGLSSPVVIVPFCNWSFDHSAQRGPWIWVPTAGTPFNAVSMIPVRYSSSLEKTCFAEQYLAEKSEAALDNLNLLYVAFTRATDILIGFCPFGASQNTVADAVYSNLETEPRQDIYRFGDPDFRNPETFAATEPAGIEVTGLSVFRHKINIIPTQEEDFTTVRYGRIIHRILESVNRLEDIEAAISGLQTLGEIQGKDLARVRKSLSPILEMPEIADWFGGNWEVRNEPVILVPGSGERRPDRVMIQGDGAVVLDYKTGIHEPSHRHQLQGYIKTLQRMGYNSVKGFLLYLDPPELVEIKVQEDFFLPFPTDPGA